MLFSTMCWLFCYGFLIILDVVVVVDQTLLRVAVEGSDNPITLEKPCQASDVSST